MRMYAEKKCNTSKKYMEGIKAAGVCWPMEAKG